MFQTFVTITGCGEDECYDFLYPEPLWEGFFDTFEDALRHYDMLFVKRFGTIAHAIHARHPELVQVEAEYDIYEDGEPVGDVRWYVNDAIWWE